jgi:hypothetical protein
MFEDRLILESRSRARRTRFPSAITRDQQQGSGSVLRQRAPATTAAQVAGMTSAQLKQHYQSRGEWPSREAKDFADYSAKENRRG